MKKKGNWCLQQFSTLCPTRSMMLTAQYYTDTVVCYLIARQDSVRVFFIADERNNVVAISLKGKYWRLDVDWAIERRNAVVHSVLSLSEGGDKLDNCLYRTIRISTDCYRERTWLWESLLAESLLSWTEICVSFVLHFDRFVVVRNYGNSFNCNTSI